MARKTISGLEWIPFVIGIITGVLNIVFWIIFAIILILTNQRPKQLLMKMFFVWGIISIIVFIGAALFGLLFNIFIG